MSKKSKKNEKNYLDFIPVKNPDIEYETDENGIVTVYRMPYETSVLIHFNIADSRAAEYFLGIL